MTLGVLAITKLLNKRKLLSYCPSGLTEILASWPESDTDLLVFSTDFLKNSLKILWNVGLKSGFISPIISGLKSELVIVRWPHAITHFSGQEIKCNFEVTTSPTGI